MLRCLKKKKKKKKKRAKIAKHISKIICHLKYYHVILLKHGEQFHSDMHITRMNDANTKLAFSNELPVNVKKVTGVAGWCDGPG